MVVDLLLLLPEMTSAEKILGVETDEFDFDGLPGAQHEFKIEIPAGKEECFYQKIVAGGKLHVSFEVRGQTDPNCCNFLPVTCRWLN